MVKELGTSGGAMRQDAALPICPPCARGDHSSHNNAGKPWDGTMVSIDAFDCKNLLDPRNQCCCRATWPTKMDERGTI